MVEVGGTVGDIESLPFLEAIRQIRKDVGRQHVLYVHVTLLPVLAATGEPKTKPTQHSVKELRGIGIQPDVIVLRADHPVSEEIREKIALFTDVAVDAVIPAVTADTLKGFSESYINALSKSYHFGFGVACLSLIISMAIFWGFRKYYKQADLTEKQKAKDAGIITEADYQNQKAKILGNK